MGSFAGVATGILLATEAPDIADIDGTFVPLAVVTAASPYPSPYDYGWYKGKPYRNRKRGHG
jgi:hypothetical protein